MGTWPSPAVHGLGAGARCHRHVRAGSRALFFPAPGLLPSLGPGPDRPLASPSLQSALHATGHRSCLSHGPQLKRPHDLPRDEGPGSLAVPDTLHHLSPTRPSVSHTDSLRPPPGPALLCVTCHLCACHQEPVGLNRPSVMHPSFHSRTHSYSHSPSPPLPSPSPSFS